MGDRENYGVLLNNNIKIKRQYFRECVRLKGIYVLHRSPLPNKHWTKYAEIDANYAPPIKIGCLFHDHPNQYTMKKLGWISELQENAALIEVDYDLEGLQVGSLFIIPSGIDGAKARIFRVARMSTEMVMPASITCEIVPEYIDTMDKVSAFDYSKSSINLISEERDTPQFLNPDETCQIGEDEDFI